MEYLTAAILSGLIYDGVKNGATIGYELLKSKLQGWIVDEKQINRIVEQLKEAGVNEDLAPHSMERKISEHQPLTDLLKKYQAALTALILVKFQELGTTLTPMIMLKFM
ncbi:hypothetical protein N7V09_20210 [Shewanella seohaensis]|uniref:GapS6a family protein n=1 Tax=Shewanella seohaensis TaxID=755175 RepID=UPI0021C6BE29|nr:hypothetical protein [Shewanella seohaensis]UXM81947.1 hypothetical protein N7V09_20210 [Shewanella seohaensis]